MAGIEAKLQKEEGPFWAYDGKQKVQWYLGNNTYPALDNEYVEILKKALTGVDAAELSPSTANLLCHSDLLELVGDKYYVTSKAKGIRYKVL